MTRRSQASAQLIELSRPPPNPKRYKVFLFIKRIKTSRFLLVLRWKHILVVKVLVLQRGAACVLVGRGLKVTLHFLELPG